MRSELVHELHRLLDARRYPVPMAEICARLECSKPHAKRVIRHMRDYLGAPILNKPGQGYFYDPTVAFELPGIWFSSRELHALLAIERLTGSLSGGLFAAQLASLRKRVTTMLGRHLPNPEELHRIRVLATGRRHRALPRFPEIAAAVLERKRLRISYAARGRGAVHRREVSPQQLVHYRGNWYLHAWCHVREALRIFSVECVDAVVMCDEPCHDVAAEELDANLTLSYGIFTGAPTAIAVLRFSEFAARWARDEAWAPGADVYELEDGGIELRVPYADPTELIMEICKYGPEVEVLAPEELRCRVKELLHLALRRYD